MNCRLMTSCAYYTKHGGVLPPEPPFNQFRDSWLVFESWAKPNPWGEVENAVGGDQAYAAFTTGLATVFQFGLRQLDYLLFHARRSQGFCTLPDAARIWYNILHGKEQGNGKN